MSSIIEKEILTTVHLSDAQRIVLTKILSSPTPQVAYESISATRNLVAARNLMAKLGLILVTDNTAAITQPGREVAKDEALIDDTGKLTDEGERYAQADRLSDLKPETDNEPTSTDGNLAAPPMESTKLIQGINAELKYLREVIKKVTP